MNEIKTKLMITKKLKDIIRFIVEACISTSWVMIHITTLVEIRSMDISSTAIQNSGGIIGISGISLPLYFLWQRIKEWKKPKPN